MKPKKIVFVGGGSVAWTPFIIRDILLTDPLQDSEFVLLDIDKKAADLTTTLLRELGKKLSVKATFTPSDSQPLALKGADYVIIAISTGGLKSMTYDLSIPEEYGIYHTVGDTSGPGGWSRLMRNFTVFENLGKNFARFCPNAVILNYTNPMTTLTSVLSKTCKSPVVGLCHGLFENLEFLKNLYPDEPLEQISVKYAGINHFFWMTAIQGKKINILEDLRKRLRNESFTDLIKESTPDRMGYHSNREVATELFRATNVMPYLGDRHTCEFFSPYITNKKNLRQYKLIRTTIRERQKYFQKGKTAILDYLKKGISDEFLKRSRETAADIISAHVKGVPFIDVGNVPNIGQISNLPLGTVVETAVCVDHNGFTPLTFGALPDIVAGWVRPYAEIFDLGVQACFERSEELALNALYLDPVCSHLNKAQIRELGKRLIKAHSPYTDFLKKKK